MAVLGEAWIEVHADTGPFDRELKAAIDAALIKAEAAMRARGRDAGNAFSDGVERAVKDRVDGIGSTLGDGLIKEAEKAGKGIKGALAGAFDDLGNGKLNLEIPDLTPGLQRNRRSIIQWARDTGSAAASAFGSAFSAVSGFVSNLFSSLSGLGQGAMIPLLIAGVAGLIGAFVGLMPILTPIAALLTSIPFLLGGIGAAAWVLVGIFGEVETAMGKAFEARTPKEVADAIDGLPPVVGRFIGSLSILGAALEKIISGATLSFFGELTETFADLQRSGLFDVLSKGANNLARAMGDLLNELLKFAQTKQFRDFVDITLNSFAEIIRDSTPGIIAFFSIIARLTKSAAPFMERFFSAIDLALRRFDQYLAENPDGISGFFEDALDIIKQLMPSISALTQMVLALIKAGSTPMGEDGKTFLEVMGEWLQKLADFLSSKEGQAALQDMIKLGAGMLVITISLVAGFLLMVKTFDDFVKNIQEGTKAVAGFFRLMYDILIGIFAGIYVGLNDLLRRIVGGIWQALKGVPEGTYQWGMRIYNGISYHFNRMKTAITGALGAAWTKITDLKTKTTNFFSGAGGWLYNAGWNIVRGLIQGLKDAVPDLKGTLSWITGLIPDFKGPEEKDKKLLVPAGKALMEGLRAGIATGAQGVLGDLQGLTGLISTNAYANTFNFGPGAIQQNFAGQATPEMGRNMGNAAGNAIANTVNQQSMRAQTRAI